MDYEKYGKVYRKGNIVLVNCDCMDLMKDAPDNYWQLACVDPPYGIGESGGDKGRGRHYKRIVVHKKKNWDKAPPKQEYFDELKRVSRNRVIWGANYFVTKISDDTMGWVFWDKIMGGDFSDGELAYTSFQKALKMVSISRHADTHGGHWRIHPTQKPVKLYEWLLTNYAEPGHRILDTHLGSGSSAIAAYYFGCDFVGMEIDEDYYKAAVNRFNHETAQIALL